MFSSLGRIYGKIADLRNTLYDKGVFEVFDLGARTISIGNITAGGTGKTPLVACVAALLAERGETVCILTRGYGRENPTRRVLVSDGKQILAEPRDAGDEPFELARRLAGKAIVIADADRVSAAEWAKRKFGVTAFVLDDGFQHRKARRDVDIVCVDATDPFGGGKMLPAGRLREPLVNLRRADIVVVTRSDLIDDLPNLKAKISDLNENAAIFEAKNEIVQVVGLERFHAKTRGTLSGENTKKEIPQKTALAFCGIGNPESFFAQLALESCVVTSTRVFRDHHTYTQQDISNIEDLARENRANILITTAKDAVKLSNLKFEIPCFVVEIKTTLSDPAAFASLV